MLTDRLLEDDPGPFPWSKLRFADVRYTTWLRATNPDPLPDYKAVRVLSEHSAVIYRVKREKRT